MPKKSGFSRVTLLAALAAVHVGMGTSPVSPADSETDKKLAVSLDAGRHDRSNVFVSVLVDAGQARSVYVEYADRTLGRAQLVEPGMLNASWRGSGKKELHFVAPDMAKGERANVVAALSEKPIEGRTYVWSGEPRQSRRLSCGQCHQGLAIPTGEALRQERKVLEETGKPPPFDLPRILPTSKGQDFRWHEKLGKYMTSACWECHSRHMVQYEFGQSLDRDLPWAPDPPQVTGATGPPAVRSVFHTVFRVRQDRAVSHPLPIEDVSSDRTVRWRMHYGFQRATVGAEPCSDILQQHVGILSEEAGKFIGRHSVLIDWVGNRHGERRVIAREERQVTVKDFRGRNRSYAMWIDFVSTLSPAAGATRFDGADRLAGLRLIPSVDDGAPPEYRESADWRAITFVSEGTTYTAVCFNHPSNPKPLAEEPPDRSRLGEESGGSDRVHALGYGFSAQLEDRNSLLVRYRLWIQGGRMPSEEIQSMSNDFVEPITIDVTSPVMRTAADQASSRSIAFSRLTASRPLVATQGGVYTSKQMVRPCHLTPGPDRVYRSDTNESPWRSWAALSPVENLSVRAVSPRATAAVRQVRCRQAGVWPPGLEDAGEASIWYPEAGIARRPSRSPCWTTAGQVALWSRCN